MTTIAWDGCTLAADKKASRNGMAHTVTKIHRLARGPYDNYLAGICGHLSTGIEVLEWLESGADPATFPERQKDSDTSAHVLMISPEGKVSLLEESYIPMSFDDTIFAIGTGREIAMGAMKFGASAREAVQIATQLDNSTGMGIDVLHLINA